MTAIRPVLQRRRPRTSPLAWFRCRRCNRLSYAEIIGQECDPCVKAVGAVWPGMGAIRGEMSGS